MEGHIIITCMICGKKYQRIQWYHLKQHEISFEEYKEKFPKALLITKESSEKYRKSMSQHYIDHPETRRKISEAGKGRKFTEEHKAKLSKAGKGRKFTEEHKAKLSKASKGRKKSPEFCVKMSKRMMGNTHLRGHKHSDETRTKMSESGKGRKLTEEHKTKLQEGAKQYRIDNPEAMSGENSGTWRGGISFEPYSPDFSRKRKKRIRERDNYICQECGAKEKKKFHHVHHIDYNKKNSDIGNLILLCETCHGKTIHNKRKYWEKRYKQKIN